jgi:hypothetical protein
MRRLTILAAACSLSTAGIALAIPAALAKVAAGQWEVSGAPGARQPVLLCVSDVLALAQFEHRGRNCSRSVVSDKGASTLINYSCGSDDFGESQIDVVTPRSLRISTQGISAQLPFNYVLQARRVGDCPNNPSSTHH